MKICPIYLKLRLLNKELHCLGCIHKRPHFNTPYCKLSCGNKYEIHRIEYKCFEIKENKNEN